MRSTLRAVPANCPLFPDEEPCLAPPAAYDYQYGPFDLPARAAEQAGAVPPTWPDWRMADRGTEMSVYGARIPLSLFVAAAATGVSKVARTPLHRRRHRRPQASQKTPPSFALASRW